jgi:hypothetical protein
MPAAPNPQAFMPQPFAPRVPAAPPMMLPPMLAGVAPQQAPRAGPAVAAPRPRTVKASHPHALPIARQPHHALVLPSGGRFRIPGGRVKVRP